MLFALKGSCDAARVAHYRHHWLALGTVGRLLRLLRDEHCRDLVFIGSLVRPSLSDLRLDWGAIKVLPAVIAAFRGGDDHLLTGIGRIFERQGIRLLGLKDVAPDLLMPEGCLTRARPDTAIEADIAKGRAVLAALSPFDIGQGCVVIDGHVVAVEDTGGTDGLLRRVAQLRGEGRIRAKPGRGVLVKAPKSGQDLRFDLPALGPTTIEGLIAAQTRRRRRGRRPHRRRRAAGDDRCRRSTPACSSIGIARMTHRTAPCRTIYPDRHRGIRRPTRRALMQALRQRLGDAVQFDGVGGTAMAREGLVSRCFRSRNCRSSASPRWCSGCR